MNHTQSNAEKQMSYPPKLSPNKNHESLGAPIYRGSYSPPNRLLSPVMFAYTERIR